MLVSVAVARPVVGAVGKHHIGSPLRWHLVICSHLWKQFIPTGFIYGSRYFCHDDVGIASPRIRLGGCGHLLVVVTLVAQEFLMGALLYNLTMVQYDNFIGVSYR